MSSPSILTSEEQQNVRAALRFLHIRFGTWQILAKALRFKRPRLVEAASGREAVGADLVLRVARLIEVPFDDVATGRYPVKGTCPSCGHVPSPS